MDSEVDLSAFAQVIQAERAADEARRFHEAEAKRYERVRDECRDQLGRLMGDASVALVHGKDVLKRTQSDQFAWARFRKEHPELAAQYTVPKLTDEIDKARLAKELPDLYASYCTIRWTNSSEVLR
jgi:hypothetical protein